MHIPGKSISPNAKKVISTLTRHGHVAYVVGGAVRDLALGIAPKDFDVATNATPTEIRKIMRNTRIIGRRFRLVHAFYTDEIIEISTFRRMTSETEIDNSGRLIRDNVFGTEEEDAWRRDFTVNALFLDPATGNVIDYVGGLNDIRKRQLRIIGEAGQRYCEDPVRMVRAVRLASKLDLALEKGTFKAIAPNLHLLDNVPKPRLFDELIKIIKSGHSCKCLNQMERLGMIDVFFPIHDKLTQRQKEWLNTALMVSDRRQHQGESVSMTIVIACIYWPSMESDYQQLVNDGTRKFSPFDNLIKQSPVNSNRLVNKRITQRVMDIYSVMARMEIAGRKKQIASLRHNVVLRKALALLRLRSEYDETLLPLVMKWDELSETPPENVPEAIDRIFMHDTPQNNPPKKGKRSRSRKTITVYIALGSNLEKPVENVRHAIDMLDRHESLTLRKTSALYETEPADCPGKQNNFVNAVVQAETTLKPSELLSLLHQIESDMGRQRRKGKNLPRIIDLDILLYGTDPVKTSNLEIPHPRMHGRAFVLVPLNEIEPSLELPDGSSVQNLLAACGGQGIKMLEEQA